MAKVFPKEVLDQVRVELVPYDRRSQTEMARIRGALNELELGQPRKAIRMLEAHRKAIEHHLDGVEKLIMTLED